VTTRAGHFNAFPIRAGSTVPDHEITDWTRLLTAIRSATVPGSTIVILNHPRDRSLKARGRTRTTAAHYPPPD
jgi:hypothetical protein